MVAIIELIISICSVLGIGSVLLFFIKRYFDRKDKDADKEKKEREQLMKTVQTSMETIKLLAYTRLSDEVERLLTKGYATPADRRLLDELYSNYKAHGWNGDMDARIQKVYSLRTDHAPSETPGE